MASDPFALLNEKVIACTRCPRLVLHRETVDCRAKEEEFTWRRPVPGFGDREAYLLVLGLAPSPQGGNRTGRVFTGDPTGAFLFKQLHAEGFANQESSISADDGLKLNGCYLTASVKCVPPGHKPLKQEFLNCSEYFETEIALLQNLKAVLTLGKDAFDSLLRFVSARGYETKGLKFGHGQIVEFPGLFTLYTSFHPSPQNTYTGKLTSEMFRKVLREIKLQHHAKRRR